MHSVQPPRGRIVFDVLCLLAVVASCAGAWMQTGASALLVAAGAVSLYAIARLFDLRRSRPVVEPQRIAFEPVKADEAAAVSVLSEPTLEAEPAEPGSKREGTGRRKGGSRTSAGCRTKAAKGAKMVELVPALDQDAPVAPGVAEPELTDPTSLDEGHHPPVAPLFEPEPFVRQQRVMFGRKSR